MLTWLVNPELPSESVSIYVAVYVPLLLYVLEWM